MKRHQIIFFLAVLLAVPVVGASQNFEDTLVLKSGNKIVCALRYYQPQSRMLTVIIDYASAGIERQAAQQRWSIDSVDYVYISDATKSSASFPSYRLNEVFDEAGKVMIEVLIGTKDWNKSSSTDEMIELRQAGYELTEFTRKTYLAVAFDVVGAGFFALGLLVAEDFFYLSSISLVASGIIHLISYIHIKRAGEHLIKYSNLQPVNPC